MLIIGYDRLRSVASQLQVRIVQTAAVLLLTLCSQSIYPPISLIIADEGHRLKSAGAKTTQALRTFKTPRRVVLSGTPIQNNLIEYFSMVDFCCPGTLDDYKTFKKVFELPILRSREPGCPKSSRELGEARADQLSRLAKSYVLRRTSEVIAHFLPPRIDYCLFVAPTALQLKLYAAVLESTEVRQIFAGQSGQHLVLINTLRKVCNVRGEVYDVEALSDACTPVCSTVKGPSRAGGLDRPSPGHLATRHDAA